MKNNKLHNILFIIALCLMTLSFFTVLYNSHHTPKIIEKRDTTIVTKTDTVIDTFEVQKIKLVPKILETVKHDTIHSDTVLTTERKYYEERFYLGKDTADISVMTTGINTSVDSIGIKLRTFKTYTTNTVEITKYVEKKKTFFSKFHFGIQGGIGYGLTNKKTDIYIGLGGSLDI